jgi:hypothetical protein
MQLNCDTHFLRVPGLEGAIAIAIDSFGDTRGEAE